MVVCVITPYECEYNSPNTSSVLHNNTPENVNNKTKTHGQHVTIVKLKRFLDRDQSHVYMYLVLRYT